MPTVPIALDTHGWPNGPHMVRARVVYGDALSAYSEPLEVVINNSLIRIETAASVPDDWEVKYVTKAQGRQLTEISLRVEGHVTVQINGVQR